MRKLLITGLLIIAAGLAQAAQYDIITVKADTITTNTALGSATVKYKECSGKIVMVSMDASTNMIAVVATEDDYGMSLAGSRAVITIPTNNIGTNSVLGTAIHTRNDKLKCSFYGSFDTNGTATATLKLLVEVK